MARYRILIEFDGSNYCGWQSQPNGVSIQDTIARAIEGLSGTFARPIAAGRTDAGVHALALPAHFDLPNDPERSANDVQNALNHYLRIRDETISIHGTLRVGDDFHARHDTVRRHYLYRIVSADAPPALQAQRVLHLYRPLALTPMQEAAATLIGEHDFSSFRAAGCQADGPVRVLESLSVAYAPTDDFSRDSSLEIIIRASAPSFLYNQVRIIVGTLILVGLQRWSPEQVALALAARNRAAAGPTAPPHGLYFLTGSARNGEPPQGGQCPQP
ncbi:MAG: tRNA pseudouridine(38-40) synthase TruA [Alphaproteobacteria bacterium]